VARVARLFMCLSACAPTPWPHNLARPKLGCTNLRTLETPNERLSLAGPLLQRPPPAVLQTEQDKPEQLVRDMPVSNSIATVAPQHCVLNRMRSTLHEKLSPHLINASASRARCCSSAFLLLRALCSTSCASGRSCCCCCCAASFVRAVRR
jgi:hypothetical protein